MLRRSGARLLDRTADELVEAAVAADPVFEAALLDAVEGVTEPAPVRTGASGQRAGRWG